jgi:Fe-S-cluster containining protein
MEYKECERCFGYCCISSPSHRYTALTEVDIRAIAKHLRIPLERFREEYVVETPEALMYDHAPFARAHIKRLPSSPCPFLRSGLCGINSVKPEICRNAKPVPLMGDVTCAMWNKVRAGV